jgi:hypothetical protein
VVDADVDRFAGENDWPPAVGVRLSGELSGFLHAAKRD